MCVCRANPRFVLFVVDVVDVGDSRGPEGAGSRPVVGLMMLWIRADVPTRVGNARTRWKKHGKCVLCLLSSSVDKPDEVEEGRHRVEVKANNDHKKTKGSRQARKKREKRARGGAKGSRKRGKGRLFRFYLFPAFPPTAVTSAPSHIPSPIPLTQSWIPPSLSCVPSWLSFLAPALSYS